MDRAIVSPHQRFGGQLAQSGCTFVKVMRVECVIPYQSNQVASAVRSLTIRQGHKSRRRLRSTHVTL